jgi:adenylylsulfate kinase-like enzyme
VSHIDGDDVRENYGKQLGFSHTDIMINNQTVVSMVDDMRKLSELVLITVIGPLKSGRQLAKEAFAPDYAEVYVVARLSTLERIDTKGLYSRVARGKINNLIGVGNGVAYEPPIDPELLIDTDARSISNSVNKFVVFISSFCNKGNHHGFYDHGHWPDSLVLQLAYLCEPQILAHVIS